MIIRLFHCIINITDGILHSGDVHLYASMKIGLSIELIMQSMAQHKPM